MNNFRLSLKFFILIFFILVAVIGIHNTLSAQAYRDGYIIMLQNDTVPGWLKYIGGKKASRHCIFRVSDDQPSKKYLPGEIKAYRLNEGKFYVSREVNNKMVFLEFLVHGTANIYFYSDKTGSHYFIETEKSGLIELSEPKRIVNTDKGTYVLPSLYYGKLATVLNDYDSIGSRAQEVKLSHNSLISLAKDYHDYVCDSVECIVFKTKIKPFNVKFDLLGGVAFNYLKFGKYVKSNWVPGPNVGLYINLHNLIASNEKVSLLSGLEYAFYKTYTLAYTSGSFNGYNVVYYGDSLRVPRKVDNSQVNGSGNGNNLAVYINLNCLKVPIAVKYYFAMGKVRPFFGVGLTNLFILSSNKEFQYVDFIGYYKNNMPLYMLGFRFQTGLVLATRKIGRINASISYEYLLNISGTVNNPQRLYMNNFAVMVGWGF